ncbi:AraC family transcriptional regulator [Anaerobacillus sp. CMMVII]|uniref:AraC family transcriptional regulator n=1 Tax=Anaerobacillus sp. CMMVII TaxID=2755588 RepID=UPI0021B80EF3|nr:AraC family transcriptional regulator [Anaerobacillus sp. CMMVII]MCT8137811.1 AraC family transcriptional regulator [Anaerobacillus sp. CMMVII]
MDWLKRMNGAINYIEDNLTGSIDYNEAAKIAYCSKYHFQRMFSYITDVPLSEYIRRRRLTLAAFDLQDSDLKVIEIALKYGYESPEAFTRAFQKLHGVTPSRARHVGSKLKAYPRMSFHISIKGDVEMNYRIEQTNDLEIFGKDIVLKPDDSPFIILPQFGDEIWENGTHDRINDIAGNIRGTSLYGVHFDFKDDGSRRYMFGWNKPDREIPDEFISLMIPKTTWAVFEGRGSMPDGLAIQDIWKRIYSEWFPTSGYEQTVGPCIEKYYWADRNQEDYICEVWIPVVKKTDLLSSII